MPRGSSVGWLGCSRVDSRPASPIVLRNRVTTRHFAGHAIRSCRRMIFETAAAISGVSPGERRRAWRGRRRPRAASRGIRRPSAPRPARRRRRSWRVDDQPGDLVRLVRDDGIVEEAAQRQIGERHLRRDPFGRDRPPRSRRAVARARRRRPRQQLRRSAKT